MAKSILIPIEFDIKDIRSVVGEIQNQLGKLNLSPDVSSKIGKAFEKVDADIRAIEKSTEGQFVKSKAHVVQLEGLYARLSKSLGQAFEGAKMPYSDSLISPQVQKDLAELQGRLEELNRTKVELRVDRLKEFLSANQQIAEVIREQTGITSENLTNEDQLTSKLREQLVLLEQQKQARMDSAAVTEEAAKALETLSKYKDPSRQNDSFARGGRADLLASLSPELSSLLTTDKKSGTYKGIQEQLTKIAQDQTQAFSTDELNQYEIKLQQVEESLKQVQSLLAVPSAQEVTIDANIQAATQQYDTKFIDGQKQAKAAQDALNGSMETTSTLVKQGSAEVQTYGDSWDQAADSQKALLNFQSRLKQLLGIGAVFTTVSKKVREAYIQIKKLDSAMNAIAVVTNMTTADLWKQIDAYMAMAKQYGVTTTGVYQVSQLYYQQGLSSTMEVMTRTTETLKMAKIAALDYATATDYMTVAINGFKLGTEDASRIVDVYSQLAAVAATDTAELAEAMSKTASIAESAGMSFENTSVFLTQMIEVTREAPENLGTAMKTIIARFQELKANPMEILDIDGEEASFNKVETALKSVGVELRDNVTQQFRNLDEVIYELAAKWDSLDRNTQRYIANTVAGSRQQSRFLALMSDNTRLLELQSEAYNSEDAALIQYAKTLDSMETKLNQFSTTWQQFYMGIINGPFVKGIIDIVTNVIENLNKLPKATGLVQMFTMIRSLGKTILNVTNEFGKIHDSYIRMTRRKYDESARMSLDAGRRDAEMYNAGFAGQEVSGMRKLKGGVGSGKLTKNFSKTGAALTSLGTALTTVSLAMDTTNRETEILAGTLNVLGTTAAGVGQIMSGQTVSGIITLVTGGINAIEMLVETADERITRLKNDLEETNIARATERSQLKELDSMVKTYKKLSATQNQNAESHEEWLSINAQIVEQYPELLSHYDAEGNAIAKLGDAYDNLRARKEEVYSTALRENINANLAALTSGEYLLRDAIGEDSRIGSGFMQTMGGRIAGGFDYLFRRGEAPNAATSNYMEAEMNQAIANALQVSSTPDEMLKNAFDAMGMEEWSDEMRAFVVDSTTDLDDLRAITGDGMVNALENLQQVYNSFEYLKSRSDRYIEQGISVLYQDWTQFSSEDLHTSSVLTIKTQEAAKKAWDEFWKEVKAREGDNADMAKAFQQFEAFQLPTIFQQEYDSLVKAPTFDRYNEDYLRANEVIENRYSLSVKDFENLSDAVKGFLPEGVAAEIQADLQASAKGAISTLSSIIGSGISEGNLDKSLASDFARRDFWVDFDKISSLYSEQILKNISDLSKLDTEGLDVTNTDLVKDYASFIDTIFERFDDPEIRRIAAEADITSYSGTRAMISALKDVDEGAGQVAEEILGGKIKAKEADVSILATSYTEAADEWSKIWAKNGKLTIEEIQDLMTTKGFTSEDFDGKYFRGTYADLQNRFIGNIKESWDRMIQELGGLENIEPETAEIYRTVSNYLENEAVANVSDLYTSLLDVFSGETLDFSDDTYRAFTSLFGEQEDLFTQTLSGYDYSGSAVDLLEYIYANLTDDLGDAAAKFTSIKQRADLMEQARLIDSKKAANQTYVMSPQATQYTEILKAARESTVTFEEADKLVKDLGYSWNDFIRTADGGFKSILTYTEDIAKIDAEINKLLKSQNKLTAQQVSQYRVLVQLKKEAAKADFEASVNPFEASGNDNVLSDVGKWLGAIGEFDDVLSGLYKDSKMSYDNLIALLENEHWGQKLAEALFPGEEFISATNTFAKMLNSGATIVEDGMVKMSGKMIDTIQKTSSDQLKAIAKSRIEQLDAQIAALEALQALGDLNLDLSPEAQLEFEAMQFKNPDTGQFMQDFDEFMTWLKDNIEDKEMWADIGIAVRLNQEGLMSDDDLMRYILEVTGGSLEFVQKAMEAGVITQEVYLDYVANLSPEAKEKFVSEMIKNGQEMTPELQAALDAHPIAVNIPINPTPTYVSGAKEALMNFAKSGLDSGVLTSEQSATITTKIEKIDTTNVVEAKSQIQGVIQEINALELDPTALQELSDVMNTLTLPGEETSTSILANAATEMGNLSASASEAAPNVQLIDEGLEGITDEKALAAATAIGKIGESADLSKQKVAGLQTQINLLRGKEVVITTKYETVGSPSSSSSSSSSGGIFSNLLSGITAGLAGATSGTKKAAAGGTSGAAGGTTLVGELGPELRVSNGQYSIVGAAGAEFVDLKKGDIIFDAEKTKKLLSGASGVRGQAFVQGTPGTSGPAMASGSGIAAAIQALKDERDVWQNILSSVSSLIDKVGKSGGKGGGGGSSADKEYLMQLERWFNYLRRIEKLENDITILRAKRQNIKDGNKYAQSLYLENEYLAKQRDLYQQLANEQIAYRNSLKTEYLQNYGKYFYFVGDAIQINADAILADTKNNEELGEAIQNLIDEYNEITQNITDNTVAVEENTAAIEANIRIMRDQYISMEQEVLKALQEMYAKQIKIKKDAADAKKKSDDAYIKALQKNLQREKDLLNASNKAQEKAELQRRIALLERDTSGKNAKEIASLKEQLRQFNQDEYFDTRSDAISKIQEASDTQQLAYQNEIDILEEANQIKLDNMRLYWDEVAAIIEQGSTAVLDFLTTFSTEYLEGSLLQQQDFIEEWKFTIESALAWASGTAESYAKQMSSAVDQVFTGNTSATGGLNTSSGSSSSSGSGSSGSTGSSGNYGAVSGISETLKRGSRGSAVSALQSALLALGYSLPKYGVDGKFEAETEAAVKAFQRNMGITVDGIVGKNTKAKFASKGYSEGGIADYTGLAIVHGSKSKPEAYLDSVDTKILRQVLDMLRNSSFKLSDFTTIGADVVNTTTNNENGISVQIGEFIVQITGDISTDIGRANAAKDMYDKFVETMQRSGNISVTRG